MRFSFTKRDSWVTNGTLALHFTEGNYMTISYNGLWKKLIDKDMCKMELADKLNISSATIAKMGKGERVSIDVLSRICEYLNCDIGDIMSFKNENEKDGANR